MSEASSITAGIAARYATALFDLSLEAGGLAKLEADTDDLAAAMSDSDDLRDLLSSPVYSRSEASDAIGAVAEAMGLDQLLTNTLRLMAQNRRLFALPALVRALRAKIAAHKGLVTADVASAKPLTAAQAAALAKTLRDVAGQDVTLNATVDESLIGGLVVKIGSRMIDTSIRARLNALRTTMKEAR